jgi:hypothetical protein
MDSPTITMEKDSALAKLDEYEQAAKRNPKQFQELDRQVMQGYRVLARGGRLVDVNEALRHGGLNLAGQPKLAIARADAKQVRWTLSSPNCVYWWHDRSHWSGQRASDRWRWVLNGVFNPQMCYYKGAVSAMTPLIPLPHRPKHDPSNYFLLWEANWFPAPPCDPYLLRPITGSLMEIIAEWEVTPIELAAVRNAMRNR